jgi:hypothetical protein
LKTLAMTATTLVAVACSSEAPKTETAATAPKPKTVQERVTRYRDCWDDFNKKAWDAFKACYTETAQSEQMGSRPALSGADAVIADAKTFLTPFLMRKARCELSLRRTTRSLVSRS